MKSSILPLKSKSLTQTGKREVSYVDLVRQHAALKKELLEAVTRVIDRGQFILGPEVEEFEKRFAELCGVRFAVAVNSGTDALILALRVLNIGAGHEVITTPNSFVSSTSCIAMVGARPVFVDVRDDYNIDPDKIEKAITPQTKAILPVHLTGRPADMDAILAIAKQHGLRVIEDAAQAVLAEYHGKRVGSFGDMGCFSLHPLKTLNACGDGGVITTNDESAYERLKRLRNLGLENRDDCVEWSGNSRLDTIQAAILLVKMNYLEAWTEKRRENARLYQALLKDISSKDISPIKLPVKDRSFENSVYHTFMIQADRRYELKTYLLKQEIGVAVHYPFPIHNQSVARSLTSEAFPMSEQIAAHILSLPIHQNLTTDDIEYVSEKIHEFYRK